MSERPGHCHIDSTRCVGCGLCVTLCPMNAITVEDGTASIDADECVECGVCTRSRACRYSAIQPGDLKWPRQLRALFSNPLAKFKDTQIYGRGTEETKTNDSQNIYGEGEIGVIIELGRPVLGTRMAEAERVTRKFAEHGYQLPENNPVRSMIVDHDAGTLRPDILQEKALSCLLEFVMPESAAEELIAILEELDREVQTVFNVCVAIRADAQGRPRLQEVFGSDIHSIPSVKVNIGMARGIIEAQK